jgi:hypothetical protein
MTHGSKEKRRKGSEALCTGAVLLRGQAAGRAKILA